MQKNKKSGRPKAMGRFMILILIALGSGGFYFRDTILATLNGVFPRGTIVPKEIAPKPMTLAEIRESGTATLYYDNGALKAERNFKDGKLEGDYRVYYENGTLKEEGHYKDDKLDGVLKKYYNSGKLKAEELYRDNSLISRKTFDDG